MSQSIFKTMRFPSLKTLSRLHWLDPKQLREVRRIIDGTEKLDHYKSVQELIRSSYKLQQLTALDEVIGGHGPEAIWDSKGVLAAEYINMGDIYNTTILYSHVHDNPWLVTSLGDFVETQEHAYHHKFS